MSANYWQVVWLCLTLQICSCDLWEFWLRMLAFIVTFLQVLRLVCTAVQQCKKHQSIFKNLRFTSHIYDMETEWMNKRTIIINQIRKKPQISVLSKQGTCRPMLRKKSYCELFGPVAIKWELMVITCNWHFLQKSTLGPFNCGYLILLFPGSISFSPNLNMTMTVPVKSILRAVKIFQSNSAYYAYWSALLWSLVLIGSDFYKNLYVNYNTPLIYYLSNIHVNLFM